MFIWMVSVETSYKMVGRFQCLFEWLTGKSYYLNGYGIKLFIWMVSGETSYCKMVTGLKCLFEWLAGKLLIKCLEDFNVYLNG